MITDAEFERILREGAELYHAQRFFEAHDKWEEAWKLVKQEKKAEKATDPRRDFLHGLILTSVAYLHWSRGNIIGATRKFEEALGLLKSYPGAFHGVQLGRLRAMATDHLRTLRRDRAKPFRKDDVPRLD